MENDKNTNSCYKKVIMCSKKQKYTNLKHNSRDAAHQKELPTTEINVT